MKLAKKIVQQALNGLGYEIAARPSRDVGGAYEAVRPTATYSPWNRDAKFRELFELVRQFTLVDQYRCFDLWKLVEQSAKLDSGDLIEIGVWRGGTGSLIASQAKRCGISGRVFLCDTFTGVVKAGTRDSVYKGREHADTSRRLVEDLVHQRMGLQNVDILEGIFPDVTGGLIADHQFRFCHVDVDVYQSARDIVEWIWPRLKDGGIVVFDDYGFRGCDGITGYVEELMPQKGKLVFHNLNGHVVVVKHEAVG